MEKRPNSKCGIESKLCVQSSRNRLKEVEDESGQESFSYGPSSSCD